MGKYNRQPDVRQTLIEERLADEAVKKAITSGDAVTAALYVAGLVQDLEQSYARQAVTLVRSKSVPSDGPGILLGVDRGSEPSPALLAIGITRQTSAKGSLVHLLTPTYDAAPRLVNAANPLPLKFEGVDGAIDWINYRVLSLTPQATDKRPIPESKYDPVVSTNRRF